MPEKKKFDPLCLSPVPPPPWGILAMLSLNSISRSLNVVEQVTGFRLLARRGTVWSLDEPLLSVCTVTAPESTNGSNMALNCLTLYFSAWPRVFSPWSKQMEAVVSLSSSPWPGPCCAVCFIPQSFVLLVKQVPIVFYPEQVQTSNLQIFRGHASTGMHHCVSSSMGRLCHNRRALAHTPQSNCA